MGLIHKIGLVGVKQDTTKEFHHKVLLFPLKRFVQRLDTDTSFHHLEPPLHRSVQLERILMLTQVFHVPLATPVSFKNQPAEALANLVL